jgi:hypothetical protein
VKATTEHVSKKAKVAHPIKASQPSKLASSKFKPPAKVQPNQATTSRTVQPEKKKKAPKPLKKLDFNHLRRSGRTTYFGPQPKHGAPGTLPDRPITIDDDEQAIGDGDLTQELNDPKLGECLTKLRNLK